MNKPKGTLSNKIKENISSYIMAWVMTLAFGFLGTSIYNTIDKSNKIEMEVQKLQVGIQGLTQQIEALNLKLGTTDATVDMIKNNLTSLTTRLQIIVTKLEERTKWKRL